VPVGDFTIALKADFLDQCYLQQDAFDAVDGATSAERQAFVFDRVMAVVELEFDFRDRAAARATLVRATDLFRNWSYAPYQGEEFQRILAEIDAFMADHAPSAANGSGPDRTVAAAAGAS
jgi:V/A-type H+/Na+-transporting ATPase subunit A